MVPPLNLGTSPAFAAATSPDAHEAPPAAAAAAEPAFETVSKGRLGSLLPQALRGDN